MVDAHAACIFASLFDALILLPDSIMVVRQILVLFVLVRIQVGQRITLSFAEGIFLSGSEASLLAIADGKKNTIRR